MVWQEGGGGGESDTLRGKLIGECSLQAEHNPSVINNSLLSFL